MAEGEGYQSRVRSFLHICDDCILPLMLWAVEEGVVKLRHEICSDITVKSLKKETYFTSL